MPEIKLTPEELRHMALLQDLTGVTVRDCIIDTNSNTVIYIVNPGQAGIAVGRNGVNVKRLREILNKNVEIVEWADSLEDLVKNLFLPARVLGMKLLSAANGRKILFVTVDPRDKGLAIGKGGRNVNKARLVLKRYYDIDVVTIV